MAGTLTTPESMILRARKAVHLEHAMRHYGVQLTENTRGNVVYGHCPLPGHQRAGGRSFRAEVDPVMDGLLRWRCLSTQCAAARTTTGSDVVAFVAEMERCSLPEAARMILGGLLFQKR
jgi:hypothetical protein